MAAIPLHRLIELFFAFSIISFSLAASAHEGHRENMSDAEMVQMEMQEAAPRHGVDGADSHHSAANVPDDQEKSGEAASQLAPEVALKAAIVEKRTKSVSDFLGRLHPLAVHFPIALLLVAALAEIMLVIRPSLGLEAIVRFLVATGAAGAVAAALLGWFATGWRLEDRSETLALHRWNGTAIGAVSLVAAWVVFRSQNRTALRALLAILAVALLAQGYLGGEMVFGPNHLGIR